MAIKSQNNRSFLRRHITAVFIATIILISGFVPFLIQTPINTPNPPYITPTGGDIPYTPINMNTVANEPNFTRQSWPFILDNYPSFSWKNPGRFNGSQAANGDILIGPTATVRGYDTRIPAVGTGPEQYPAIFSALEGLNESNIRIMYMDADYNWISVPYQIDQRGWVNIWYPGDLNKWGGLDAGGSANDLFSNGGGEHVAADVTNGMGWIAGDIVNSEGTANYNGWPGGSGANDLLLEWYRIPTWTFVTPRQADGSISNEMVDIDSEYRNNLIWCYMMNRTYRPHTAWLAGDTGGTGGSTNDWNVMFGTPAGQQTWRNMYPCYANMTRTTWRPAWVNTTNGNDAIPNAQKDPRVDANGWTNTVFMGDTWFTTPGDYATTAGGWTIPSTFWMRKAFPYKQINGGLDKDDQLCFYVYPGRQAPSYLWWNYSSFPQRFELKIVDPVDGGQSWMYIYYNNNSAWNPLVSWKNPTAGKNLGAPVFTTVDDNGNPISDYVSWDPAGRTITTDFYRTSVNDTNPTLMDSLQLFGNTDGQNILTSFNKMYLFGYISITQGGQSWSTTWAFGREGIWYDWSWTPSGRSRAYSDLVCSLDNPAVLYPGISRDTSQVRTYWNDLTADRSLPSCPTNYYGPMGWDRVKTRQNYTVWERNYGDGRALIDGPCRVIFYLQQFLSTGLHPSISVSGTTVINDYVDLIVPIMDGPQFYYRRMQLGAPTSVEIPSLSGFVIQVYYVYVDCGNLNPAIRGDFNITAAQEYSGGADGTDQHEPKFGFNSGYGYTKYGGNDPKNPVGAAYRYLGYCIPSPAYNTTNFFPSQGNPLLQTTPPGQMVPPDGNPQKLPDWAMINSETHGAVWLYIPRREANETRDNNGRSGATCKVKMYLRDDVRQAEFGVVLDGGASPWIQGGTTTSEYKMMMVFGEFPKAQQLAIGHKLYCDYFFPIEAITTFTSSPAPNPNQFVYQSVTPDKLVYKTGEKIYLVVTGSPKNATITLNTKNIRSTDANGTMTNRGDGTWNYTYTIAAVDGTAYNRYITFAAKVTGPLWGAARTCSINLTIDNIAPSPTGQLAALSYATEGTSVLLDWTAVPGFDIGCSSIANPSGLGWYMLKRWNVSEATDGVVLADQIPITTTQFVDSFVQNGIKYNYKLYTYDEVGNSATSTVVSTFIRLPFTPAQPATLKPTQKTGSGIVIDWSQNPGSGSAITGYRVYRASTLGGTYTDVSGLLASTVKTWTYNTGLTEASYHYFKVLTNTAAINLFSTAVFTRIDNVVPAAAQLATPLPDYRSAEAEIIVTWAMETLPEYQTGGFPGQDLNGIDHWTVYKKIGTAPWKTLATLPYGELPEEQRVTDVAVTNGTTYSYAIRTFDGAGNAALCQYNVTTRLIVVGPGKAEPFKVTVGSSIVEQGATSIPVTVLVRNPGRYQCTVNTVKLYLIKDTVNVTSQYKGISLAGGGTLAAFTNRTYTFAVNVTTTATLGTIKVDAQTIYNATKTWIGATFPSEWGVTPDASLNVETVSSPKIIVYPGQKNIPLGVTVRNPGKSIAYVGTIQLTFTQGGLDVTDKFLATRLTSLPTVGFNQTFVGINFNITVSQSAVAGGVLVNAFVTGSSGGVPLEDTDGATSPLNWAVQTSAKPVIVSIVADKVVYWSTQVITLTVTCDKAGHIVRAFFGPLDGSTTNETATDNGGGHYTVTHTMLTAIGENTYLATVYAQNATYPAVNTGVVKQTFGIRLGQAPTFSNWVQTPIEPYIEYTLSVLVKIDIVDAGGVAAYVKYRLEGGSWSVKTMTKATGNQWNVTIPAQGTGGLLEYAINATDPQGNWALYSKSYTINPCPSTAVWIQGTQAAYNPSIPTQKYNETPGYGAPRGQAVAYKATIDTEFMTGGGANYVVVMSAFDPNRNCYISVNQSVWLQKPTDPTVTLFITYPTSIPSGTLITGRLYICTGLPSSSGGLTLSSIKFTHLVE